MTCPGCKEDYKESLRKYREKFKGGKSKRLTVEVLPSDFDDYQISGIACPGCGYVGEFIKHPTGNPFYKREPLTDIKWLYSTGSLWAYLEEKNLVSDFEHFIKNWKEVKRAGSKSKD